MPPPTPSTFSPLAVATMLVALVASGWCFAWLCRRWTTDRPRSALAEWSRGRRFHLDYAPAARLPGGLAILSAADPRPDLAVVRGPVVVVRLTTAPPAPGQPRPTWHLLVRTTPRPPGDPVALRPAFAPHGASVVDLLPTLGGYPSLLPPERFVAFGTDVRSAKRLANSAARGLLPHDVGLLVHGPAVVLDFSRRPFDGVEFDRMMAVADQVVGHMAG